MISHKSQCMEKKEGEEDPKKLQALVGKDGTKYTLLSTLGSGTYGTVFLAQKEASEETFAIKRLKSSANDIIMGMSMSAVREAAALKSLGAHENIVHLKEVIITPGDNTVCFVTELCTCNLSDLLLLSSSRLSDDGRNKKRLLSFPVIGSAMRQLLSGLEFCHERRIIHRDLKPENILVKEDGQGGFIIKLADFGLARPLMNAEYTNTNCGTLPYRGPELLLGNKRYDGKAADMWSTGCILAQMLNGEPLFQSSHEWILMLQIFHMLGTPTEETWPGVSGLPNYLASFPKWPCPGESVRAFAKKAVPDARRRKSFAMNSLLFKMLRMNPALRISASMALFCIGVHTLQNDRGDKKRKVDEI